MEVTVEVYEVPEVTVEVYEVLEVTDNAELYALSVIEAFLPVV